MFGLAGIDMTPLFYGVVMFAGMASMYYKLVRGRLVTFIAEISVFSLVFWLHGGTMAGGFAAMVCALLTGLFLSWRGRRKS